MGQNLQVLRGAPQVQVGDKVVVNLGKRIVQLMQNGHGGWVNDMENHLGKKGKVSKIDSDGDVHIQFGIITYVFNPDVVAKVLSKGDKVLISDNIEKAKFLQENHGGWNPAMKNILGEVCHVKRVLKTYDVMVTVDGKNWCLNPLLLTVIEKSSSDAAEDDDDSDDDMIGHILSGELQEAIRSLFGGVHTSIAEMLSMGSLSDIKKLHACVYQGDKEMTESLLEKGVDINETDDDGDTALHIAVMKNNPRIVRLLLKKGAKANIRNKKKFAPIHLAVWTGFDQCVKELLDTSINLKDKDGDTPLGLAIVKERSDIIDLLLGHSDIDLEITNENGFTAIHLAAKRGSVEAVRKICEKKPSIVNEQKDDGFSALHLAALNGHLALVEILIQKAKANMDLKTIIGQTPLMLAAMGSYIDIVKFLVSKEADINAQDNDGNTALHLTINTKNTEAANILKVLLSNSTPDNAVNVAIFLVENGASLSIKNNEKRTPLDMIDDDNLKANLERRSKKGQKMSCLICSKENLLVMFEPCGHMKLCAECYQKNKQIKQCMECKVEITTVFQPESNGKKKTSNVRNLFEIGDQVCINMNEEAFVKQEAEDRPHFKELLQKVGTVEHTERTDKILVRFEGKGYLIPAEMLIKVREKSSKVKRIEEL